MCTATMGRLGTEDSIPVFTKVEQKEYQGIKLWLETGAYPGKTMQKRHLLNVPTSPSCSETRELFCCQRTFQMDEWRGGVLCVTFIFLNDPEPVILLRRKHNLIFSSCFSRVVFRGLGFFLLLFLVVEFSQNHKVTGWLRRDSGGKTDLWRSPGPTPMLKQSHLEPIVQDYLQMTFEYLPGRRLSFALSLTHSPPSLHSVLIFRRKCARSCIRTYMHVCTSARLPILLNTVRGSIQDRKL